MIFPFLIHTLYYYSEKHVRENNPKLHKHQKKVAETYDQVGSYFVCNVFDWDNIFSTKFRNFYLGLLWFFFVTRRYLEKNECILINGLLRIIWDRINVIVSLVSWDYIGKEYSSKCPSPHKYFSSFTIR